MERNNLIKSGKRTGTESQLFLEPENDNERKKTPDLYRELTDLTSQVRMISDSLAACTQLSKCRPHRKVCDIVIKGNSLPKPETSISSQVLFAMEEKSSGFQSDEDREKNSTVSHKVNEKSRPKEHQKSQKSGSKRETFTRKEPENKSEKCLSEKYCQNLRILSSSKENPQELRPRSSKIVMYDPREVDPARMIEVIERELKTLMEMTPPVALLVTALSDTIFHCKECFKCSEKISSSLPWILNRVQKLIKYVTIKRHGTYSWPNDYSYLRLIPSEPTINEAEVGSESESSEEKSESGEITQGQDYNQERKQEQEQEQEQDKDQEREPDHNQEQEQEQNQKQEESGWELGVSGKVDAIDIVDGRPGVQIVLNVQPETKKKQFFDRAAQRFVKRFLASFPIEYLTEPNSAPVVHILRPSPKLRVIRDKRRALLLPKELSHACRQVFALSSRSQFSFLLLSPVIRTSSIQKINRALFFKPIEPFEEQIHQLKKNSVTLLVPWRVKRNKPKSLRESSSQTYRLNEKKLFPPINLLADAPQIVKDLLKEAEEEKMQLQNVKELESEVKGLKDLMLEVHKNQMELSKILLEKGVYSQPIIKLTDPNMLEEENQAVRKVAETEGFGRKNSVKALQSTVDSLKQKCTLKNRMIVTLLKGLRSNVPKEWWEEVIDSMFDESRPIEEFDPVKVSEFIRQSSLFLMDGEKASRESLPASRSEERQSEEEPNMKKIVGTDGQDHLSYLDQKFGKTKKYRMPIINLEEFLDCEAPVKILAFPVSKSPEKMTNSIRKLENQVSLLNMENERLWHEIYELKGLLKDSVKELHERKISHAYSNKQLSDKIKTSGKVINLTIQIASEKDLGLRRFNDGGFLKSIKVREASSDTDSSEISKSSRVMKEIASESLIEEKETDSEESNQDQNLTILGVESKFRSKSERRRSENDLNFLDDLSPTISYYRQENEKLRALLREKAFFREPNRSVQKLMVSTPNVSSHEISPNAKPVTWVPSKYSIPEASGGFQAGPSRKPPDLRCLLQNPSQMELTERQNAEMFATMANERELQTIPEVDHTSSNSSASISRDVSQIVQHLRTRVRSIHKDVTVLKSKNDRIDKMLDRLMDDVVDNNKNFEEMGNNLNNLKNQLG